MVKVVDAKDDEPRQIALHPCTVSILRYYIQNVRPNADEAAPLFLSIYGKQVLPNTLGHQLSDFSAERGVADASAHRFRATCATLHRALGRSEFDLMAKLGHNSLTMTDRYSCEAAKILAPELVNYPPLPNESNIDFISRVLMEQGKLDPRFYILRASSPTVPAASNLETTAPRAAVVPNDLFRERLRSLSASEFAAMMSYCMNSESEAIRALAPHLVAYME